MLSKKEQKLLDFIKISENKVTIKLIREQLGNGYVGCLGRLLNEQLIEKKKDRPDNTLNVYGTKKITYYIIK